MKKHQTNKFTAGIPAFLAAILSITIIIFLAECTTTVAPIDMPAELFFVSQSLPDLNIPVEVGGRTENPEDETGIIPDAFREAYREALLRGVELTGVLGSDWVNPWPAAEPLSWSQNWENAERTPNSWGLENLVLALGNYHALSEPEKTRSLVFCVHEPVLDMFGKSAGYSRANGVSGYGIPLGDVFYSNGAAVQRFGRGRMIISPEGNRFSFEDDLFEHMLETLDSQKIEAEFKGRNIPPEVSNAFIYAWAFVFSEKEGTSDGPVVKVAFSKPWILETEKEKISINGFYYKSYNNHHDILVLADGPQLPVRAHFLSGSFLKAILSGRRLSGLESAKKLGTPSGTGLGRSLAEGFAIYGLPLSDPLPLSISKLQKISPDSLNNMREDSEGMLFLEAQRFSRGWIVAKP